MKIKTQSRLLSILIGLAFLSGVVFLCTNPAGAAGETAIVAGSSVNVRNGPGTNYGVIAQVNLGDQLTVLGQSTGWYNVRLADGGQGWVAGWLVSFETAQSGGAQPVADNPAPVTVAAIDLGAAEYNLEVFVNGNVVNFPDQKPFIDAALGRTYVPLRFVSEALGCEIKWDGENQKIEITKGALSINLIIGSNVAFIKNDDVQREVVIAPPELVNERTMVPLRFISEALGAEVDYTPAGEINKCKIEIREKPAGTVEEDAGRETIEGSGAKVAVVNGSVVNVRSGPGTSNAVIGTVVQGNSLPVLGQSGDWCQVSLPTGGNGWVAGWLVALNDAAPAEPAVEQPGGSEVSRGGGRSDNSTTGKVLSMNVQKTATDQTTFAIKTDTPVSYNSFFLSNPDRLVIDIEGVTPGELPETKNVSSKTVSNVRSGHYLKDPDVTRLVFELKSGVQYEVSLSGNKKTINVDTYIPKLDGAYKNRIIVLDPGHGGSDPGAIGPNGTQEKNVNLDIAKRVSKLLEAQGAKVIMTRNVDTDVSLYTCTNIANKNKADIYVSIHINANTDPSIGGTTSYIHDGTGSTSETPRLQESNKLARSIQTELIKSLGLRDIGVKEANFAVLRTSNMPAVLLELAFISKPAEEKLIKTDSFKNKSAEAIVKGIGTYFAQKRTA